MATIFKLNPEPTFRAVVSIPDAGAEPMELEVEFKRKTKDELTKFFGAIENGKEVETLLEIMVTWHNCETQFNKETLTTLLQNYPKADTAILGKYAKESMGARLGN